MNQYNERIFRIIRQIELEQNREKRMQMMREVERIFSRRN